MKVNSNKIRDVFNHYSLLMQDLYSQKEANLLLKRLIAHFIESETYRIPDIDGDKRVNESTLLKIHFGVKSLLKYMPLEYIIEEVEFYESKFFVNENVLIPRPETEELVDLIWKNSSLFKSNSIGLDIGTGSGCIAITLSKLLNNRMLACDISSKAIEVAKRNSNKFSTDVEFIQLDFLDSNSWSHLPFELDFIVSNPPYIRDNEKNMMHENVLNFEPHNALFVPNDDPLIFYRAILEFAILHLKKNGYVFLEINEFLGSETQSLYLATCKKVNIINDLNGKQRLIIAQF